MKIDATISTEKNIAFVSLKLTELALLDYFTGVLMKQAMCWHKLFVKNPF